MYPTGFDHAEVAKVLRTGFSRGERFSDLLRSLVLQHTLGKLESIRCVREAFGLSLSQAAPIMGWGADGSGEVTHERLDDLAGREIEAAQRFWMAEAEWFACVEPAPMLALLSDRLNFQLHAPTFRRAALFACACCRRFWTSLSDPRSRALVEMIERDVDVGVDVEVIWEAEDAAKEAADEIGQYATSAIWSLAELSHEATSTQTDSIANTASEAYAFAHLGEWDPLSPDWIATVKAERRHQASLLRDIFGNPFRPVVFSPSWRTSAAIALAAQMYESRDFDVMPILADALQDAGCDNTDVLDHCRGPGPHARGCWVVDRVLGKE